MWEQVASVSSVWRSEKSGFDLSGVPGSSWAIWSLFMVLFILHHSFQSICVPSCRSWKKRNLWEGGVWNNGEGGMDCMLCSAVRQLKWRKVGTGEGKDQVKWRYVWRPAVGYKCRGDTALTQVPSRSSSQARFQENSISSSCILTLLCCPVQVCDCCCFSSCLDSCIWTWLLLTVICSVRGGSHLDRDQFNWCLSQLLSQHSQALPWGAELFPESKTSSLEQQPSESQGDLTSVLAQCLGEGSPLQPAPLSPGPVSLQVWKKEE